jgi:hypothetical protein
MFFHDKTSFVSIGMIDDYPIGLAVGWHSTRQDQW